MVYASQASPRERVNVHLNPDVTIMVGDQVMSFFDANGNPVFPIIYQGTTYLPVRAISSLMGENIEWDHASRTVFIGRTLTNPANPGQAAGNYARPGSISPIGRPPVQIIEALVMRDVIIMYNFHRQHFLDVAGREVFPINFQGSNYLPVRAISRLMGETIEWDAGQRLITISNSNDNNENNNIDDNEEKEPVPERSTEHIGVMNRILADVVTAFDRTTANIIQLQGNLSEAELFALMALVGADLQRVNQAMTEINAMRTDDFTEEDLEAHSKLFDYAEAASFYVLIAENILYMAATGQNFSIFAETFLAFAMNAQTKHEAAVYALRNL